jgi:hypothetical protein
MKLRSLFKDEDIQIAIENAGDSHAPYISVAEELSAYGYGDVSRQLARYWCKQFETTKKNGEAYLTLAVANRKLKAEREVRIPSPSDQAATIYQSEDSSCILFFTDSHAPYHHPDLLQFLEKVADTYEPTMIINGGDEVDNHALSFHNSDPNLSAPGQELEQAQLFIHDLHELFPDMRICESNHGSLIYRRAKAHGIPVQYIKTYRQILFPNGGGEGWSWHDFIRIQMPMGKDLQFQHSCTGDLLKGAAHENANLYVGHEHSKFGIGYGSNALEMYHSVYGGCTLDPKAMAFAYGKLFPAKPCTGCVIIEGGVPHAIPMVLDANNRWIGVL